MDEKGKTLISAKGKTVLKPSYSVLQDDFFHAMRAAGYTDVERGERGSTEEHLTVTQFKVAQEQQRLEDITAQVEKSQQTLAKADAAKEKKEKELSALEEKPYLDALEIASEKVRAFLSVILARGKMEPERKQPTHSRKRDMEI